MRRSGRFRLTVAATGSAVILASCTSSGTSSPHTPAASIASEFSMPSRVSIGTGGSAERPGAAGCDPPSPISVGPEVQGTGIAATLYGLIMTTSPLPIRTDEQVKIVWRMTGSGPLQLSITSPHGNPMSLQWGPDLHTGSDYHRPGTEWGAGYLFTQAGCWHLHAQRTVGSADVWLEVQQK